MSANVHHIHTNVRHRLVCQLLQVEAHSKVATSSNDGMPKVELESLLCRAYIINPAHVLCPAAPGAGQDPQRAQKATLFGHGSSKRRFFDLWHFLHAKVAPGIIAKYIMVTPIKIYLFDVVA